MKHKQVTPWKAAAPVALLTVSILAAAIFPRVGVWALVVVVILLATLFAYHREK